MSETTSADAGIETSLCSHEIMTILAAAEKLPGKAPISVALLVCTEALRLARHKHIMITRRAIERAGMTRVSVYRGLEQLEGVGLMSVRRTRGQAPLVTIIQQEEYDEPSRSHLS